MSNATGGRQSNPSGLITREAARDLSAQQYHTMKLDTAGRVDYASTGVLGVLQNAPAAAYKEAEIATEGTSLLVVDGNAGAIAVGAKLGADGSYQGIAVTADTAEYFAIAMEASTAAGDIIEVKLLGPQTISV